MPRTLSWLSGVMDQYGNRLLFGQIPRMYYGNDAGFFNNFIAKRELRALQKKIHGGSFAGNHETLDFKQQGYLQIKNCYDSDLLKKIKKKYDDIIDDDQYSIFIGPRVRTALRAIKNPLSNIVELSSLLTDNVQRHIEAYYGTCFKVLHVRCWRIYHVDASAAKKDVYSNLWHNDPFPTSLLRYFVYLSDGVNKNTGSLHLHSIENTKKIMRNGYLRRRAIIGPALKMIEDPQRIIVFSGNIGDGCLLNPQLCLHRAGVPSYGRHRDMVQFTLAPTRDPLPSNWYLGLPPDPEGIRM